MDNGSTTDRAGINLLKLVSRQEPAGTVDIVGATGDVQKFVKDFECLN